MLSKKINRKWAWGVVAAAAVLAAPSPFQSAVALGQSYEDLATAVNATETELRDEDARFAQETAGMNKGSRTYRDAAKRHDDKVKEIRDRRAKLKVQAEKAKTSAVKNAGGKLENVGDAIANEKQRHAEAQKRLPAGSAAAQIEDQRYEDKMRELRTRRDDVKEDVGSAKQVAAAGQQYKRDAKQLAAAVEAENKRHAQATKYMPANSLQAQEEDRYHAQRLRDINDGKDAAADQRDLAVAGVQANKAVDGDLDNVKTQIAQEEARHQRRMAQVANGSAAHAEENRQYADNMARLTGRKAELENRAANARGGAREQYDLKRQLDDLDRQLAAENDRFTRRLNDIDSGSEQERLERARHAQVVGDLNARRADTVARLNGAGGTTASGR